MTFHKLFYLRETVCVMTQINQPQRRWMPHLHNFPILRLFSVRHVNRLAQFVSVIWRTIVAFIKFSLRLCFDFSFLFQIEIISGTSLNCEWSNQLTNDAVLCDLLWFIWLYHQMLIHFPFNMLIKVSRFFSTDMHELKIIIVNKFIGLSLCINVNARNKFHGRK